MTNMVHLQRVIRQLPNTYTFARTLAAIAIIYIMYFGVLRAPIAHHKVYKKYIKYTYIASNVTKSNTPVSRSRNELYYDSNQIRYITEGKPALLLYNKFICSNRDSNVTLLYVYSGPDNIKNRNFIRQTYGNMNTYNNFKLVTIFIVGRKLQDEPNFISPKIIQEYEQYKDIVVGDFIETYRNLSWKGLTALNYINTYCKNAKFVIKADDDTILDIRGIMELLNTSYKYRTRFLIGYVRSGGRPKRCKKKHKWCVTKKVYPKEHYPPYMLGMGFIYSRDLVSDIYQQALNIPVHPVDDVYITGVLTEGIQDKKMVDLGHQFLEDAKSRTWKRLKRGDDIKVGHMRGVEGLEKAWKVIQARYGTS